MEIPVTLFSDEYYAHLRDFRDQAYEESTYDGRRHRLGPFAFGTVYAHWETEDENSVFLSEKGLRIGSYAWPDCPTTLQIYEQFGNDRYKIKTFAMELDSVGCIDVFSTMSIDGSWGEFFGERRSRRIDQRHNLAEPTDDDLRLLYHELRRGATGLFVPEYDDSETED